MFLDFKNKNTERVIKSFLEKEKIFEVKEGEIFLLEKPSSNLSLKK